MRAKFPKHEFSSSDTIHFGPDEYATRQWNSQEITDLDRFLHNGNSCTPSVAASEGYFYKLLLKMDFGGGDTAYIVAEGDTNDIWIYEGKHTYIYMYDKNGKELQQKYELAWGGAGEGPWFETDSWILDLNNDSKPDILTRETGEWLATEFNGDPTDHSLDTITAVTWSDTGFVAINIHSPDSLKHIYKTYYRSQ